MTPPKIDPRWTMRSLFWKARVVVKTWLARHAVIIEMCDRCGRRQPLVWYSQDPVWFEVVRDVGGVLCPECFEWTARNRGYFVVWVPELEVIQGGGK